MRLRCPAADVFLARQWVSHAFRRVAERRSWSWLIKRSQFLLNARYNTGTVALTRGSASVVGTGTTFTSSMVGRQFRAGITSPIYTVVNFTDAQHITLDDLWGPATQTSIGYEIYNAYVTVPSDFHAFITVWDANFNWQLWRTITQDELNSWDAQRAQTGTGWAMVPYAYDPLTSPPLPRYEVWPHQKSDYVYPFLYESRAVDLEDAGATLPRFIRGDMLLEMALTQAARWPGASNDSRNPYFNIQLAREHDLRAEQMIAEAERQDDEIWEQDIKYTGPTGLPFAAIPMLDAGWLQSHA